MKKLPMSQETYLKRMKAVLEAHALHGGRVVQVFPNAGLPRFILLKTENGIIAELGPDLYARKFNLAWKIPKGLNSTVIGLMQLAIMPAEINGLTPAQLLRELDQTAMTPDDRVTLIALVSVVIENLHRHLGMELHKLISLPVGKTRKAKAESIKKTLCSAVDALNKQSKAELHKAKVRFEKDDAPLPISYAAIEEARLFVLREKREPSKGELRELLERHHKGSLPKSTSLGFWAEIWKEAGLAGLSRKGKW